MNELEIDIAIVEVEDAREVLHHVLLAKQVEVGPPVLLRKNNVLRQIPYHFHVELLVLVVYFADAFQALDQLAEQTNYHLVNTATKLIPILNHNRSNFGH